MPLPLSAPDRLLRSTTRGLRALPLSVVEALNRRLITNDRGARLDPHLQLLLQLEARITRMAQKTTVPRARADMRRSISLAERYPVQVEVTEDRSPAGLRRRRYHPGGNALPMLVYFHGGGWVVGDLDTHDSFCRRLAKEAGLIVLSVEYRLAPEHPFPTPIEDALCAYREARAQAASLGADPERVGVGGDSAGGHLSAAVCGRLREAGEPQPVWQLLLYPALDLTCSSPSHRLFAEGFLLSEHDVGWFLEHFACAVPADPLVSPHFQPLEALEGLAPAIVATAGFDPLRDEGERHARRLAEAGVKVIHLDEAALVHGYPHLDGAIAEAERAVGRVVEALRVVSPYPSGRR